ncbi:hypothetical protein F5Y05DRAFT_22319 [Hypoxylon sp. FL0543]|nr:hypothetical protein F5Y05DRAFT_22319 [Hypoxylon sp. FL0543]
MASAKVRAQRALAAVPFLFIAAWCLHNMDINKLVAMQQPFVESGVIEWENGKKRVLILDHFHNIDILDQLWRGTTATFSPSTFGYDRIAWWQMFSFLVDLGPVYAVWILESCRARNAYTPAFFPTIFSLAGQLLGLGAVAPIFYFLCFVFGPTASELARSPVKDRAIHAEDIGLLFPIVLLLHTAEVFAMFLAPEPSTRHFWTWAWQLTPLWIGMAHYLVSAIMKALLPKPVILNLPKYPFFLLLGFISAGVWLYVLAFSPYSLRTIFIPAPEAQSEFIAHVRKALQTDHLASFGSSFLWLLYSFFDLSSTRPLGNEWLYTIAMLPVVGAIAGPGAAFAFGWYLRHRSLLAVT